MLLDPRKSLEFSIQKSPNPIKPVKERNAFTVILNALGCDRTISNTKTAIATGTKTCFTIPLTLTLSRKGRGDFHTSPPLMGWDQGEKDQGDFPCGYFVDCFRKKGISWVPLNRVSRLRRVLCVMIPFKEGSLFSFI
jgi:hypothetical protein